MWVGVEEGREYLVGIAVDVGGPGAAADAVSGFEEEGFETLFVSEFLLRDGDDCKDKMRMHVPATVRSLVAVNPQYPPPMTMTSHGSFVSFMLVGGDMTPSEGTPCVSPAWGVHWYPSREVMLLGTVVDKRSV